MTAVSASRGLMGIGDVLAILRPEFDDVTISKIRFLETQGLIDPERTPSGYRKFYDADVERLRVILRGQREQFLPLRVIKERLDTGALERPAGERSTGAVTPSGGIRRPLPDGVDTPGQPPSFGTTSTTSADQLCSLAGVEMSFLDELEEYGIITSGRLGGWRTYDGESVEAAVAAAELARLGIEPRHLRLWRQGVDKEMALVEQIVLPLMAQKHADSKAKAGDAADKEAQAEAAAMAEIRSHAADIAAKTAEQPPPATAA